MVYVIFLELAVMWCALYSYLFTNKCILEFCRWRCCFLSLVSLVIYISLWKPGITCSESSEICNFRELIKIYTVYVYEKKHKEINQFDNKYCKNSLHNQSVSRGQKKVMHQAGVHLCALVQSF